MTYGADGVALVAYILGKVICTVLICHLAFIFFHNDGVALTRLNFLC